MSSPVTNSITICNSALLKLGAPIISSLSGTDKASVICNTLYAIIRDEVMGSAPWRFAKKRAILAPNATTPLFSYQYTYDLPNDCLRPLTPDDDHIVWIQEGQTILTDEPALNLIYLYRNTDESSWDARFCEAMAWRLCMELALGLTQSADLFKTASAMYKDAISQARAMNAVIGTIPPLEADIWTEARRGGNAWRRSQGQVT